MDYDDFTIPYIIDTVPNSPEGNQLPTKYKKLNILDVNGEDPISTKGGLENLKCYQTQHVKPKVNLIFFRRKS